MTYVQLQMLSIHWIRCRRWLSRFMCTYYSLSFQCYRILCNSKGPCSLGSYKLMKVSSIQCMVFCRLNHKVFVMYVCISSGCRFNLFFEWLRTNSFYFMLFNLIKYMTFPNSHRVSALCGCPGSAQLTLGLQQIVSMKKTLHK